MTTEAAPRTPSLPELFALQAEAIRRSVHNCLPGKVDRYYVNENRADIKPVLQDRIPTRGGEELLESLPIIPSVPIVFPRAGGFFITLPVAVGDLVTLVFSDRSLDNYLSGRGMDTDPDDFRTHDLSDAYALLGGYPFGMAVTDSGIDTNLVMGKEGGAQVHIQSDLVELFKSSNMQFVALAQKVLDELTAAKNDRVANKTIFDDHIHITTATISVGPIGVIAKPAIGFPAQTAPSSVAASKVKAT